MLKKNKIDINKYFKEMCDDSIVFSKKILKSVMSITIKQHKKIIQKDVGWLLI